MALPSEFEIFVRTFPKEDQSTERAQAMALKQIVEESLKIKVPDILASLWSEVGTGYFGKRRELYLFGSANDGLRDSFCAWNTKDFWAPVFPWPKDGGPVFFAETCFGLQLGFRWEGAQCLAVMFIPDTFESFVMTPNFHELFINILNGIDSVVDSKRLEAVHQRLGQLPNDAHYAPIVSPLIGGTLTPENFILESPNAHLRTAIATYQSLNTTTKFRK